jgi:hypothetical protein
MVISGGTASVGSAETLVQEFIHKVVLAMKSINKY